MELERGRIFTPDKKKLLIDEVQRELSLIEAEIKRRPSVDALKSVKTDLQTNLGVLIDKKGVITPQETDDILDLIGKAKRIRLETDYYFGIKRSTFYLIALVAVGVGIYFYTKKRNS